MIKKYSLILIAFLCSFFYGNAQCLSDDFNSGYGNWTGNGTYQNGTAGFTGDGTGFNSLGDEIITTSAYTNPQTMTIWLARSASTANRTLSIQYSTSNTGPWTSARDILVGEVTTTHQEFTININQTGDYYIRIAMTQRSGGSYYLDDVEMTCSSGPSITVNPTILTGFTYDEGSGPSGAQSFTVSGSNLTDDIDVAPPLNWEISTAIGGPYQTTAISFNQTGGTVATQTVYTRMVNGLTNAGSPYAGNITATSILDVITENVAVDGTVTVPSSCTTIFSDDFSSGLGSWTEGTANDWTTTGGELKHNLSGVAGESYIYSNLGSQNLNAGNYEWEVCIRNGNWGPSGSNRFSYFLLSDNSNLQSNGNGYAVGVNMTGTADDYITLYEVTNDTYSEIIEATAFAWDTNEDVCIRVTRNTSGDWELFYDENGNGEVSGGTVTDNTHSSGSYIGQFFDFSSTRAGLLWIDDVSVCSDVVISGPELQLNNGTSNVDCGTFDIDFGTVESNNSFSEVSFLINNIGSSTLTISSLSLTGDPSFSIVFPASLPPPDITVPAGGSQTVTVRFEPTTVGSDSATLTITNDDTDEGSCTVTLQGEGVLNSGNGPLMITQYFEGSGFNKWIEIANISNSTIADASIYFLASYNQSYNSSTMTCSQRPLNGLPTNSIALPSISMAPGDVIRLCEPTPNGTTGPNYAAPSTPNGPTGNDGNPTYYMFNQSFSGDDIIVISTTDDADCYNNRIDIIGEYSSPCGTANWGQQKSFVRNEACGTAATSSITFDVNDWTEYAFDDVLITNATAGTNEYIGQHFQGTTTFTGGAWNNGLPNDTRDVVISSDYDTSVNGSFEACTLTVSAGVTLDITDGNYVGVETDVTINTNGTLEIRNQGQLVQVDDTGTVTNNGTTNVRKTTAPMNQYDYVYWSSPVDYGPPTPPLGIAFVLTEFVANRMYSFNTANFNDDLPDANGDGFDDEQDDWTLHTSYMEPGIGYATMTSNTSLAANNALFSGTVNNGPINVSIVLSSDGGGDVDGDNDDWNLVGNPYPSAISADSLVSQNTNIDGTLYFWTHNTAIAGIPGPDALNFSGSDYALYNATGGIGTSATSGGTAPTGRIASGQGFFVDAIANGTLSFNNSMRNIAIANDDFFRSNGSTASASEEKTRMWLNLTNPDGAYSQLLIGYFDDATNYKDRLYDGVRISGTNYIDFYSIDEGFMQYGIQGRSSFSELDVVPLGYNSNITGALTIELHQREGELTTHSVYLHDRLLNIVHDLTQSNYVFEAQLGITNDRFEILYNQDTLGTNNSTITSDNLVIYEQANGLVTFKLNGSNQLGTIEIIDLLGRTLFELDGEGLSQKSYDLSSLSAATYIAKVTLVDGQIISKKTIKRR